MPPATHYLRLDFDKGGEPKPVSVLAEATVMDVNRQAWTGTTTLLVHPASIICGPAQRSLLCRARHAPQGRLHRHRPGRQPRGRPPGGSHRPRAWIGNTADGDWKEVEADVQTCTSRAPPRRPSPAPSDTPLGGTYRITATVTDDQGRRNQSQFTRWVSGGELPPSRKVEQEKLTLIPDKETYQPGDTAQILVQSPFSPAEGLLTVNRSGILYTQRFRVEDGTATLRSPSKKPISPT